MEKYPLNDFEKEAMYAAYKRAVEKQYGMIPAQEYDERMREIIDFLGL